MKKLFTLLLASLATTQVMATDHQVTCPLVVLSGTLSNRTLDKDSMYLLRNCVSVPSGVTVVAEEGVIIMGEKTTNGGIVFRKGSEFISQGTSSAPVIWSSDQTAGNKLPGDWAGIVFEGHATNNQSNSITLEDRTCAVNGGGTDDNDYSGVLKFMRIEYAVNGLTMLSIGDQTEFHDVMVSYSSNDALQLFGGTVPFKRFIAFNAYHDDIVARYGNRSMAQYIVNLRSDPNAHIGSASSIVFDNDDAVSGPVNHPRFSNVSIIGPNYCLPMGIHGDFENGVYYRGGTEGTVANSVVDGWQHGLLMEGNDVMTNATDNGTLFFYENSLLDNTASPQYAFVSGSWTSLCATSINNWITGTGFCSQANNQIPVATLGYSSTICGSYSLTPPTFLLGSNTLGSSDFPSGSDLDDAFFISTSSKHGALNTSTDWTVVWANWYPQGVEYCGQDANKSAHTTGVNNVNATLNTLTIAPNPVSGITYAEFTSKQSGKINITVVNGIGQTVRSISKDVSKGKQKIGISTDGLSSGVYLINVELNKDAAIHSRVLVK